MGPVIVWVSCHIVLFAGEGAIEATWNVEQAAKSALSRSSVLHVPYVSLLRSCCYNLPKHTGGSGIAEFAFVFGGVGVQGGVAGMAAATHLLLFLLFVFSVFRMHGDCGSGS